MLPHSHCACAVIIILPVAAGIVRDKRRRAISNYRPITRSAEIKQLIVQVISRRGLAVRDEQYIDFKIPRIYKSIKGSQQNRAPVYFFGVMACENNVNMHIT